MPSNNPTAVGHTDSSDQPSQGTFGTDNRAIEGLPIRLVIALIVGVAALAIMMNMLGGIGDFGETEVHIEYQDDQNVLHLSDLQNSNSELVEMEVYAEDGETVEDATVMVSGGSAQLEQTLTEQTGPDSHEAEFRLGDTAASDSGVDLRSDQNRGTLEVEIIPPADSDYVDEQANTEIVIIDDT